MMTKTFLILIFGVRNVYIWQEKSFDWSPLHRSHGLIAEGIKDDVKQAQRVKNWKSGPGRKM